MANRPPNTKTATRKRRPKKNQRTNRVKTTGWVLATAMLAIVAYLVATAQSPAPRPITPHEGHDLEQVHMPDGTPSEMIEYLGFRMSFNPTTHQPNYVAWELLASEVDGDEPRSNDFAPDPYVKESATPDDYRHTGYDRGHMAPAGDMKWNPTAMRQSFLMTNISPQAPELNRGAWKKLEEKCRVKAQADSAIIIVCGPIFDNPGQPAMNIGNTGVAVPDRFFKVVLSPYTDPPQAIGFIMTNGHVDGGMQNAAVSVDSVESLTGFDFFAALPDDIENTIESRCDFNRWSHIKRRR